MQIALVMIAAVAVLAVALAAMAITDSVIPGWIAVAALLVWGIGRSLLMGINGIGGDTDEDGDLDVDL